MDLINFAFPRKLFEEQGLQFTDIVIVHKTTEWKMHKIILSLQCGYFGASLKTFPTDRIDLSECNFEHCILDAIFQAVYKNFEKTDLIEWLKNGRPVHMLLKAADYFQFDEFVTMTNEFLEEVERSNKIDLLKFESAFNCIDSVGDWILTNRNSNFYKWIVLFLQEQAWKIHTDPLPITAYMLLLENGFDYNHATEIFDWIIDALKSFPKSDTEQLKKQIIEKYPFSKVTIANAWKILNSATDAFAVYFPPEESMHLPTPWKQRKWIQNCSIREVLKYNYRDYKFEIIIDVCLLYIQFHSVKLMPLLCIRIFDGDNERCCFTVDDKSRCHTYDQITWNLPASLHAKHFILDVEFIDLVESIVDSSTSEFETSPESSSEDSSSGDSSNSMSE